MNQESFSYQVDLPVFQGPLDLLLHLVQKRELDITAVSLAAVADQFLEYLAKMEETNADMIADFLVVAAKLLVLKSWALLPSANPSPEEEEIAQDLTAALLEYQLFKEASAALHTWEGNATHAFPRVARPALQTQPVLEETPLVELVQAMLKWLQANDDEHTKDSVPLPSRILTVEEKVAAIQQALASGPRINFISLLDQNVSRLEIVVTFLAVLELLKRGQIALEQSGTFADIYLLAN